MIRVFVSPAVTMTLEELEAGQASGRFRSKMEEIEKSERVDTLLACHQMGR